MAFHQSLTGFRCDAVESPYTHRTVLLHEAVDALSIKPNGVYVDGTFGRGGHSRLILDRLGSGGSLVALDRDRAAVLAGESIHDARFKVVHDTFSRIRSVLRHLNINKVDGILLDLGVSSPQLEEASRGFSFRLQGSLDMRMDTSGGETVAEWLAHVSENQLEEVIKSYGEERFAKQIARAIVAARARQPVNTTLQLAAIVAEAVPAGKWKNKQNPATRTFQALRIYINQELEKLAQALPECVEALNSGGRLVVISFHSLEDRAVKRFLRSSANPDVVPRAVPLRAKEVQSLSRHTLRMVGKAIRPGAQETALNPRARSAVMRVAERVNVASAR
jgi:16S rRNA (cytosine1402-N4)-methyltransferase